MDAYIDNGSATTNFGTETGLRIGEGNGSTNDLNRSLIKFDLSSIPASATITSATLSLWTTNDFSDNDRTIRVYRLKVPFHEREATWNESASEASWQSAGASGTNDHRESTDIGSVLVLANESSGTEKQISLNTTKIQEMVSGTFTNNGFIIIADTELNDRFNYKSSDASTSSQRPKLVIQYTTSSATNTPGPSPTPTASQTPSGPTATPTRTPTPGASNTPTPTAPPAFQNATFLYDGDGKRVKSTFNGTSTTYFVGTYYEVTGSTVTKYYYAGAQRIAMRTGGELKFILGDHLGSTSLVTDANGENGIETRYKAWGEVRYASGPTPTDYTYTGQFSYMGDFGLMFYNARWYDPYLNHFTQPDTIVPNPNNPQAWDRYAYVGNNPIRYNDPSGHRPCEDGNCQINPLAYRITYGFGWILKGDDWTSKELQTIFVTGNKIKNYVDNITNGKGQEWMNTYLGGTNLVHSPWYLPQNQNLTLPGWLSGGTNTVNLFPGWENQDGGVRWLTHEMGHIWDMNTGRTGPWGTVGGVADSLNTFIGGGIADPKLDFRYLNGPGKPADPHIPPGMIINGTVELTQFNPSVAGGYGNGSTADYLAESFAWNVIDHQTAPRAASVWVDLAIIAQAASLP